MTNNLKSLLIEVANDRTDFIINYPNFGKVNVKIIGFELINPTWKPVKVQILDKLFREETMYVDDDCSFNYDSEPGKIAKKVSVRWTEEFCMSEWFEI